MPQIDPKFTFWFGVWTNLLMFVAGYGIDHAPQVIQQYAPGVQWVVGMLGQANGVLLTAMVGISSSGMGPLVKVPAAAVKSVVILAILLTGLLAFPGDAMAQVKLVKPTGNIVNDIAAATGKTAASQPSQALETVMSAIAKPFQDLADFVASDAAGAAALAIAVPGLQDTNGRACWIKMQNAGAVFQAHPVPLTLKVMTDFEALRLLQMTANDLCAYVPCTVVFSDGANLAVAAASAVGGALTSNAVPSLTQLCARIPQISQMLPAAVTGPIPAPVVTPNAPADK